MWVNLGAALEFDDVTTEKRIFQKLLDGGVYIVCCLISFAKIYPTE